MSLKWVPRGLAEAAPLATARAWVLRTVAKRDYQGAAAGAVVGAVTLGLLMLFVTGAVQQHPSGDSRPVSMPHQARHQAAAPSQPGQHHHGQAPAAAAGPRWATVKDWTSSATPVGWVSPTGQSSSPSSPATAPAPAPTLSLPGQRFPTPAPTLSLPGQPLPTPTATQSPASPAPSSS
jgi:hypothetical protein